MRLERDCEEHPLGSDERDDFEEAFDPRLRARGYRDFVM
jgi:hypothetical protein